MPVLLADPLPPNAKQEFPYQGHGELDQSAAHFLEAHRPARWRLTASVANAHRIMLIWECHPTHETGIRPGRNRCLPVRTTPRRTCQPFFRSTFPSSLVLRKPRVSSDSRRGKLGRHLSDTRHCPLSHSSNIKSATIGRWSDPRSLPTKLFLHFNGGPHSTWSIRVPCHDVCLVPPKPVVDWE